MPAEREPTAATPVAALCRVLRENATLASVASTIGWDEQTQLPAAGTALRADQSSLLARLVHARATGPDLADALQAAEADDPQGDDDAVVREARRDFDRATKLPASLVEALARAEVNGHAAWVKARQADDFDAFVPSLTHMLELKREESACVAPHAADPYAALLDDYEPDESPAYLDAVFAELKGPLVDLVGRIASSGRVPDRGLLRREYPVERQRELSRRVAAGIGFDFDAGRLDTAVHPFCSGIGPGDTRMTTRFDPHDFGNAFFSTLHETGHALYEQGLDKHAHFGTALATSAGLGVHESQSRLWENFVGRGRAFWRHVFPVARDLFPDALADVDADAFVWACNDVRPSFIRTESDEATYNLHVLLRYEIERALLSGDLAADDLPAAWDEKMRAYLGVVPDRHGLGCLQDVHWSVGLIGYFPTYTLGNVYAACLFEAVTDHLGGETERDAMFARGEFGPLLVWLREHIHSRARRDGGRETIRHATGVEPTVGPLLNHLNRKASEFYGV